MSVRPSDEVRDLNVVEEVIEAVHLGVWDSMSPTALSGQADHPRNVPPDEHVLLVLVVVRGDNEGRGPVASGRAREALVVEGRPSNSRVAK